MTFDMAKGNAERGRSSIWPLIKETKTSYLTSTLYYIFTLIVINKSMTTLYGTVKALK